MRRAFIRVVVLLNQPRVAGLHLHVLVSQINHIDSFPFFSFCSCKYHDCRYV